MYSSLIYTSNLIIIYKIVFNIIDIIDINEKRFFFSNFIIFVLLLNCVFE